MVDEYSTKEYFQYRFDTIDAQLLEIKTALKDYNTNCLDTRCKFDDRLDSVEKKQAERNGILDTKQYHGTLFWGKIVGVFTALMAVIEFMKWHGR